MPVNLIKMESLVISITSFSITPFCVIEKISILPNGIVDRIGVISSRNGSYHGTGVSAE